MAVVTSLVLELVDGYADLNPLSILDVAKHLFIDGTLLDHLHKGVKEELVGVGPLLLVGLKLLLELSGNRNLLRLQETLQEHIDGTVDVI